MLAASTPPPPLYRDVTPAGAVPANAAPVVFRNGTASASPLASASTTSPLDYTAQSASPDVLAGRLSKPKQKRNKPTLSCAECSERKTKCDRGRPSCLACVKRSTTCSYSSIAKIINTTDNARSRRATSKAVPSPASPAPQITSSKLSIANITHPRSVTGTPKPQDDLSHKSRFETSIGLSSLSMPKHGHNVSIFEGGGKHPFANYWTSTGGLAEVITVLPTKSQADILMCKYFQIIDPLYPVIPRGQFFAEYEHFWSLSDAEKAKVDPSMLALHFVLYASATQYLQVLEPTECAQTAEFYISAAHQALSISSYLNRMTIATSQAMTLIYFFLINDNHVSDAWTFSGITLRQGYVLQLNRNPEVVVPTASLEEKRLRIRLWTVISIQDTGLALNLKLPPCATVCDITPQTFRYYESMLDHESQTPTINDVFTSGSYPRGMDEMDSKYLSAFWTLSILVAEHICKPRALAKPICRSREHQRDIINQFYEAYNQIPAPYGTLDPERFYHSDERRSRQQICLCSNFFQYVMLVAADDNREDGVPPDYFITLEAAHEGLQGFFALFNRFGNETNGWWAYQHRAFEQAFTIASVLADEAKLPSPTGPGRDASAKVYNLLLQAKRDVHRVLEVIKVSRGYFEFQSVKERRYDTLKAVYDAIQIV